MRLRLSKPSVVIVLLSACFGAAAGVGTTQLMAASGQPDCPQTVMKAVSTNATVQGTFQCFNTDQQAGLQSVGIDSDNSFAARIGQAGEYHFVRKTADRGYVYEYDRPRAPHDRLKGALAKLGVPVISADLRQGNLIGAWNVPNDLPAAWSELTGQSQNERSELFTFYVDGNGKITMVK